MHLRRAVRNLASKARFYGEIANVSVRSSSAAASTSSSFTRTALDITKVLGGRETYCRGSHAFHDIRYQIHQERSSLIEDLSRADGLHALFRGHLRRNLVSVEAANQFGVYHGKHHMLPRLVRTLASDSASQASGKTGEDKRKDMSTIEDPFDAPTYHIPEKPVTFTEGASYSLIILAGLGIAGAAAYAVFKELIFEPKEYKIFGKALERVQNDSQVRVRIGSPVTGYGQESRNRAARQRIPHRIWTDEDGVEHVEVNFYIRGPHGAGKVYSEMFKDKTDKQWKFTYLIVEIKSPSPVQLMLESYVPA